MLAEPKTCRRFFVEKWGLLFVHFEKNLFGVQRYQIDIDDNRMEPNCERRNQLSDRGWEYVKTVLFAKHYYIVDQYGEYGIKEYENVQLSGKYWSIPGQREKQK